MWGGLCGDADLYGPGVRCLQCGYYLTEGEEVGLCYTSRGQVAATSRGHASKPVRVLGSVR